MPMKRKYIIIFLILFCFLAFMLFKLYDSLCIMTYCDYHHKDKELLINNVYKNADLDSFIELMCGCYEDIPERQLCEFMGDSARCVLAYNYLTFLVDEESDSCLYYELKFFACGNYSSLSTLKERIPFKQTIVDWIDKSRYIGEPEDYYHSSHLYSHEIVKMDSFITAIESGRDTLGYQILRQIAPTNRLLPVAKLLADSMHYPLAIQDTYVCYLKQYGYPFMMDTERFQEAYYYLEKGVQMEYLPCILSKASLLLTGTYLPQDIKTGETLLDECTTSHIVCSWIETYKD